MIPRFIEQGKNQWCDSLSPYLHQLRQKWRSLSNLDEINSESSSLYMEGPFSFETKLAANYSEQGI